MSASYYRRAYDASKAYYPGINLATLKFLIAALEPPPPAGKRPSSGKRTYQDLALEIRTNLEKQLADRTKQASEPKQQPGAAVGAGEPPGEPDDIHWQLASLGEACLLLEDNEAVEYYRRALTHENTDSHARETTIKQANRVMGQQAKGNAKKIHSQLRKLFKDFTGPAGDAPARPSAGKPAPD
jgi:hypothetical protein